MSNLNKLDFLQSVDKLFWIFPLYVRQYNFVTLDVGESLEILFSDINVPRQSSLAVKSRFSMYCHWIFGHF